MFITKKRLQEEINREREKAFAEAYKEHSERDNFKYIHDRIDRLESRVCELECVKYDPDAKAYPVR